MQEQTSSDELVVAAKRTLPLIDLTSLGDNDTDDMIIELCSQATTRFGPVGAVCVWPEFVALAVDQLQGTSIPVAAVANFPLGRPDIDLAVSDTKRIMADGGAEVDVVYPWQSHADGDLEIGHRLVSASKDALEGRGLLKVILETGELADEELIRSVAKQAMASGADFLKTSTGKTSHSATPEAVAILLEVVAEAGGAPGGNGTSCGVKVSGGVKTVAQAAQYLALADRIMGPDWVSPATFRFGASSLLGDVVATLEQADEAKTVS